MTYHDWRPGNTALAGRLQQLSCCLCVCGYVVSSSPLDVPLYLCWASVVHPIWFVLFFSRSVGLNHVFMTMFTTEAGSAGCSGKGELFHFKYVPGLTACQVDALILHKSQKRRVLVFVLVIMSTCQVITHQYLLGQSDWLTVVYINPKAYVNNFFFCFASDTETLSPDAPKIVLGDFNDYTLTKT